MDGMKEFNSAVIAGQLYPCFVDYCLEGIQFCSITGRRCEYCNAHFRDCFTNLQAANCTEYCMDQWIQNWKNQNAEKCTENDLYQVSFFVLLGICICNVIALLFSSACNPRVRRWVLSNIKCLKRGTANNPTHCLSCGHPSTALISSNGQIISPSTTTIPNTNSGTSLTHINAAGTSAQSNVAQNIPNIDRQDGDGRSHFICFDRDERRHGAQNRAHQQRVQQSSPNTIRKEQVPPAQYLTKSNTARKQNDIVAKDRDKSAVTEPLMKYASNGMMQHNNLDESETRAKQVNDGDINRPLGNELSNVRSSGLAALPYFCAGNEDTGYGTAEV